MIVEQAKQVCKFHFLLALLIGFR